MEPMKGLETPEVVEALLSYVPPEDLKNARAVAKLWRDESLDNFRKSLVYVLDPKTESELLLKVTLGIGAEANERGQNVASLLPPMYRFQEKPFKKYRLMTSQEFPPTNMESYEQKRYFWELCGPHITDLYMENNSYFAKSSFIDGLIWLFKTCPNLEMLSFLPIWSPEKNTVVEDDLDIEQRIKRIGSLRKVPIPISQNDLEKIRENPALNMKSLVIPFAGELGIMTQAKQFEHYDEIALQDIAHRSRFRTFWWCVLSLMPNLKTLIIERQYFEVMETLLAGSLTTGQVIHLETFIFNGGKIVYSVSQFRLEPSLKYLEHLGQVGSFLKNLTLKNISRFHFWDHPTAFRNVLFRIREKIEKFHFGFKNTMALALQHFGHCKFDLFNFIFPNLTELTLEFHYDERRIFLFFDFSIFRGTPNLTRFKMKYLHVSDKDSLRKPLATTYLKKGGPGEKWHMLEEVRESGKEEGMEILQGDGDETFDPAGKRGGKWEDEIVLGKMKEFYFTGRFTTKAILVFGKWMKNLKEFGIIFDDETIFIPFIVWPGTLKKLTVLKLSFHGEEKVSEKSISDLKEMYPEVEIVVEDEVEIYFDGFRFDEDGDED